MAWTDAQLSAINTRGKTLLVSAAAGSGKTATLTERIIRSLIGDKEAGLAPMEISRMLVVTFTRAAAAELKTRISKSLSEQLAKEPQNTHLYRQLVDLPGAHISTIDSFYIDTVRSNFEKLGLPANFRIADEVELNSLAFKTINSVIDEFYDRYDPEAHASRGEADFSYIEKNEFAALVDNLLAIKDGEKLPASLLSIYSAMSNYPEGIDKFTQIASSLSSIDHKSFLTSEYGSPIRQYLIGLFHSWCDELSGAISYFECDPPYAEACNDAFSKNIAFFEYGIELLSRSDVSYRDFANYIASFSAQKLGSIKSAFKTDRSEKYRKLNDKTKELVQKVWDNYCSLTDEALDAQIRTTARFCSILHKFYTVYDERSRAEKLSRSMFGFDDIKKFMLALTVNPDGTPTDTAKEINSRFDAIYVDEYQDVDVLQDMIFSAIGGGNKRFMVGDLKQSIYGFKGTEPTVFTGYKKKFADSLSDEAKTSDDICIFMSNNFRCEKPIVDFANKVCSFIFSSCPDSIGYLDQDDLAYSKKPSEFEAPKVSVAIVDNDGSSDDEDAPSGETRYIVSAIKNLIANEKKLDGSPYTAKDIAVLARKTRMIAPIKKTLEAVGISVVVEQNEKTSNSPQMRYILNVLSVINNPHLDVPLSQILPHKPFSFSLRDVVALRTAREESSSDSLYDCILKYNAEDTELTKKCQDFCRWLDEYRAMATKLSCDKLLRALGNDAAMEDVYEHPMFLAAYNASLMRQKNAFCGLSDFLLYFKHAVESNSIAVKSASDSENAVTVCTIHKSKGLEFPAVFVSNANANFSSIDLEQNIIFNKELGVSMKLYDAAQMKLGESILRVAGFHKQFENAIEEEIRVLYVALTRAREKLFVTAQLRKRDDIEAIMKRVSSIKRGDRNAILTQRQMLSVKQGYQQITYLGWILAALSKQVGDESYEILHIDPASLCDTKAEAVPESTTDTTVEREPSKTEQKYRDILAWHEGRSDTENKIARLPSKIAASKLSRGVIADLIKFGEISEGIKIRLDIMKRADGRFALTGLGSKKQATAAEIGTATHKFMQYCNWASVQKSGVREEISRLVSEKYILREDAAAIDEKCVERFFESDFFGLAKSAVEVQRELHFSYFEDLDKFAPDEESASALRGEKIFVQGSIDLLLVMPNGELILCDYKTDRLRDSDPAKIKAQLRRDHASQLKCYERAILGMYGKAPARAFIYSFPLGEAVEI